MTPFCARWQAENQGGKRLGDETSVSEQKGVMQWTGIESGARPKFKIQRSKFKILITLGYLFFVFVFSALIDAKKLSKNEQSKVKRWKMAFG